MRTLYALDFDGVICDSVGESSLSGWKACVRRLRRKHATPFPNSDAPVCCPLCSGC